MHPKRVLDLFCGAGGAAMGLHRAWPDAQIVGIDIVAQPNYPFRFLQMDWRDALNYWQRGTFDFIWASPPCQAYSSLRSKKSNRVRPEYIVPLRNELLRTGAPYTIENVPGAPLIDAVTLCGQYFGLRVRRHRKFETLFSVAQPNCKPYHIAHPVAVYGDHPESKALSPGSGGRIYRAHSLEAGQTAMGIDWMPWKELTQAIPPPYSQYIAEQFSKVT